MYPALRTADPDHFGIVVAGVTGATHGAGDSAVPFSIMSVAKPFVFALACAALGADGVRARIGVNATGLPFNALTAVERSPDGRTNPMVNPGAIATTALVAGRDPVDEAWERITAGLSAFAGRALAVDEEPLPLGGRHQPPQPLPRPVPLRAGRARRPTPTRPSSSTPGRAASR